MHLWSGELASAESELCKCVALLSETPAHVEAKDGPGQAQGWLLALRAYCLVLSVATALASGKLAALHSGIECPLLAELEELSCQLDTAPAPESARWLSGPMLHAVGALLHAALHRTFGRLAPAAAALAKAEEAIGQQLRHHGIDICAATESELTPQELWAGRLGVQLKGLLEQQQAAGMLVTTKLAQAASAICGLGGSIDRFPSMLSSLRPSMHILAGAYAQVLGDRSAAIVHFQQVSTPAQSTSQSEGHAAAHLARLAAASVAICELEDGAGAGLATAEQLGRAADALAAFGPTTSAALATLSPLDQAAMQLAAGKLAERRGEVSEARVQLTKALKLAHNTIGNTQLVTQMLNLMAPIQDGKGDVTGAMAMLQSAATLCKTLGDLPSMVRTLQVASHVYDRMGSSDKVTRNRLYLEQKQRELCASVHAARGSSAHSPVVAWGLDE